MPASRTRTWTCMPLAILCQSRFRPGPCFLRIKLFVVAHENERQAGQSWRDLPFLCNSIGIMKLRAVSVLALFVTLVSQHAEAGQQTYQHPPESLAQLVDAPITPAVRPTPDGQMLLLLHRPSFPSIAECAQQELRLAGTLINPAVSGSSRAGYSAQLGLMRLAEDEERAITRPPGRGAHSQCAGLSRRHAYRLNGRRLRPH